MSEILNDLYHNTYPLAQRLNLVGSWALNEGLHRQAITEAITVSDPEVLYCGTATANNPLDVERALIAKGYDPSLTVVDIASKPLEQLPRRMNSVQASGTDLPFDDDSFDIITTDFLFNVIDLKTVRSVSKEWSRVLRPDGIITTTLYTTDSGTLLGNYQNRRFIHSEEALQTALQCEALKSTFTPFQFDRKPLLYPDLPTHVVIKNETEDAAEKAEKAQRLWHDAETVSAITKTNSGMAPRNLSEIIASVINGSYEIDMDGQGVLAFSGLQELSDDWYELGPLFVRPDMRNSGLGSELVRRKLAKAHEASIIAFTNDEAAENIFIKEGFRQEALYALPRAIMRAIIADRVRTPLRTRAISRVAFHGGKRLFVRS